MLNHFIHIIFFVLFGNSVIFSNPINFLFKHFSEEGLRKKNMDNLFGNLLDYKPSELQKRIKQVVEEEAPTQGDALHVGWNSAVDNIDPDEPADEEWLGDLANNLKRASKDKEIQDL
jgi:hypothetical protein